MMQNEMSRDEMVFVAELLDYASDVLSTATADFLPERARRIHENNPWMAREYHEWNGDPEEYVEGEILDYHWLWCAYYADKLRESASQ